jgi:hypothetical protein
MGLSIRWRRRSAGACEGGGEVSLWQVRELVPDEGIGEKRRGCCARRIRPCAGRKPIAIGRSRCDHLWHPNALWQHGRPDAKLPRSNRRIVGDGALVGKVGSAFRSTASQHGGQSSACRKRSSPLAADSIHALREQKLVLHAQGFGDQPAFFGVLGGSIASSTADSPSETW